MADEYDAMEPTPLNLSRADMVDTGNAPLDNLRERTLLHEPLPILREAVQDLLRAASIAVAHPGRVKVSIESSLAADARSSRRWPKWLGHEIRVNAGLAHLMLDAARLHMLTTRMEDLQGNVVLDTFLATAKLDGAQGGRRQLC